MKHVQKEFNQCCCAIKMKMGKYTKMKMRNCGMTSVLDRINFTPYCLCWDSREFFRSVGRGGVQPDLYIRSAIEVVHTTTDFKPHYLMDLWLNLKLNLHLSIQYEIYSGVDYHK